MPSESSIGKDLYLNQPGRAFAVAMVWSMATASLFSVTTAIVLILVARFGVHDRDWRTLWLTLSAALLWLGFYTIALVALVVGAILKMLPRRTVARPAVRFQSRVNR
jgi:hypothetical protein